MQICMPLKILHRLYAENTNLYTKYPMLTFVNKRTKLIELQIN